MEMIRLGIVGAALLISGCMAVPVGPSEAEIDQDFRELLATTSVAVEKNGDPEADYRLSEFVEGLRTSKIFAHIDYAESAQFEPDLIISNYSGDLGMPDWRGFQCFEPMLLVVTLGIVPAHCNHTHTGVASIRSPHTTSIELPPAEYTSKSVFSWLWAPLTAISPNWMLTRDKPTHSHVYLSWLQEKELEIRELLTRQTETVP